MKYPIIIMNFTHVYEEEFINKQNYIWIDCTHIEGTNCYCDDDSLFKIKNIIKDYPAQGVHFIDSGNYHYLTEVWTDKIITPFSLLLFDHHPDMQSPYFEKIISCGGWVKDMLDTNPYLKKVFIIGASEKLKIETKGYDDRVKYFGEEYIKDINNWIDLFTLHTNEPLYISVDKDVFDEKYAVTNWDQGSLSLCKLEQLLNIIIENQKIIGIDICGEFSDFMDCTEQKNIIINEYTNMNILKFLKSKMKSSKLI